MRIACPSCAAEYDVPESRVRPGKMVRCARCGGEWMAAEAVEDIAAPVEAAKSAEDFRAEAQVGQSTELPITAPSMTAMGQLAAYRPPSPSQAGLFSAWVLTAVVLVGAVAAAVTWRDEIVRIWPPSSRILASGGHPVSKPAQISGDGAK